MDSSKPFDLKAANKDYLDDLKALNLGEFKFKSSKDELKPSVKGLSFNKKLKNSDGVNDRQKSRARVNSFSSFKK